MKIQSLLNIANDYVRTNFLRLVFLVIALVCAYTLASQAIVYKYGDRAQTITEILDTELDLSEYRVGVVFGGGVEADNPRPLLRDRLDLAARLVRTGQIDTLIVSGDNRFLNYNEPLVMFEYLTEEEGIDPQRIQPDFAGRSTYETCERAHKIFGLDKALLISESTHLPRALYLCDHFGIDAYGIVSDGNASSGLKVGQRWREVLARNKAVFNTTVWGENTVLGDPIEL